MSEEEKNAIDYIKGIRYGNEYLEHITIYNEDLGIILNLIEKQAKEIEKLKASQCVYKDTSSCIKSLSFETYTKLEEYIQKQKIKDIINKYIKEIEEEKDYRYTLDCEDEQRRIRSIEKELLDEENV